MMTILLPLSAGFIMILGLWDSCCKAVRSDLERLSWLSVFGLKCLRVFMFVWMNFLVR